RGPLGPRAGRPLHGRGRAGGTPALPGRRLAYTCCQGGGKRAISAPQQRGKFRNSLIYETVWQMDSFEFNKIAGAVLATGLSLVALNITAEAIFAPHHPAKPGFEIEVKPQVAATGPGAQAAPDEPIEKLLTSATIDRGESAAKACAACHNFQKGGPN